MTATPPPSEPEPALDESRGGQAQGPTSRWGLVLRWVFLLVVVAGAAYWVYREREGVAEALTRVSLASLGLALAVTLLGLWAGVTAWRTLLRGLGSALSPREGGRIFFIGQLGKYIPGGVWTVMAHATLGRELAVPRTRTAAASLLSILLQAITAALLGATLVLASGPSTLTSYGWVAVGLVPLLLLLHPTVFALAARWAGKVLRRPVAVDRIPSAHVWSAAGWLGLSHVANGAAVLALASSIATSRPPVALVIGVTSLATAVGLVAFFAPAGAGVREVIIVLGLAEYLDTGAALLVVILARLVAIAADFALAGAFARWASAGADVSASGTD